MVRLRTSTTFKLVLVLSELLRGKCQESWLLEHFAGLLLHLPVASPIAHIFLGIRLLFFDHTDSAQSARIEQIQKVSTNEYSQTTNFINFTSFVVEMNRNYS